MDDFSTRRKNLWRKIQDLNRQKSRSDEENEGGKDGDGCLDTQKTLGLRNNLVEGIKVKF